MQFGGETQIASRREPRTEAPSEPVRQLHVVGAPAEHEPTVSRELDPLIHFLAEDRVEREIELPGADAFLIVLRKGQLHHAPDGEGHGVLAILRQHVDLAADPEVPELIVRPALRDEGIVIDQPSGLGLA